MNKPLFRVSFMATTATIVASAFGQNVTSDQLNVRVPLPGQSGGTTIATAVAGSYPITFTVAGAGTIADVNLTLNFGTRIATNTTVGGADDFAGREHTFAGDLDMLLVGPTGASVFFMSDAGSSNNLRGTYTFDDEAAALIPSTVVGTTSDPVANGSYRVSAYTPTEVFFSPAPGTPYGTTFAGFDGTNPNGTWSLYILDDAAGDWGYLDSAVLNLTPVPEPATMAAIGIGIAALAARRRRK